MWPNDEHEHRAYTLFAYLVQSEDCKNIANINGQYQIISSTTRQHLRYAFLYFHILNEMAEAKVLPACREKCSGCATISSENIKVNHLLIN